MKRLALAILAVGLIFSACSTSRNTDSTTTDTTRTDTTSVDTTRTGRPVQ